MHKKTCLTIAALLMTTALTTSLYTLPASGRVEARGNTDIDLHRLSPDILNKMFKDAVDKSDGKTFQKLLSVNHELREKAKALKDEKKLDLLIQISNLAGGEIMIINDDNLQSFANSIDPDNINTIEKASALFRLRRILSGGNPERLVQILKRVRGLLTKKISLKDWNRTSYLSKSGPEYVLLQTLSELAKISYNSGDYYTARDYFKELPSNFIPQDEDLTLKWADMNLRGLGGVSENRELAKEILRDYYRVGTNDPRPRVLLVDYPGLSVLI